MNQDQQEEYQHFRSSSSTSFTTPSCSSSSSGTSSFASCPSPLHKNRRIRISTTSSKNYNRSSRTNHYTSFEVPRGYRKQLKQAVPWMTNKEANQYAEFADFIHSTNDPSYSNLLAASPIMRNQRKLLGGQETDEFINGVLTLITYKPGSSILKLKIKSSAINIVSSLTDNICSKD